MLGSGSQQRTCLHSTWNAYFYFFCEPFHFLKICYVPWIIIQTRCSIYVDWHNQKKFGLSSSIISGKNNSVFKNMPFLVKIMPDFKQNSKISILGGQRWNFPGNKISFNWDFICESSYPYYELNIYWIITLGVQSSSRKLNGSQVCFSCGVKSSLQCCESENQQIYRRVAFW